MSFINQYSFLLVGLASVLALAFFLLRRGMRSQDLIALGALIVGLSLAFYFLQPGKSSNEDIQGINDQIGGGTPVLLEMQSPY